MTTNHFDYIFIGNGMAGLKLALALSEDSFFDNKRIALIDQSKKNSNDKTWCFWEDKGGKWDEILFKTWSKGIFYSSDDSIQLNLNPYTYKMVRSIDFYSMIKNKISRKSNFIFIEDEIKSVEENDEVKITGTKSQYVANKVFDSRIPDQYFNYNDSYTRIFQHFKGWIIETEKDVFDPDTFTMMDYRIKHLNDTTFTYVLPFSKRKALVEFTFFTPYLIEEDLYDEYLKDYIKNILKVKNYTILENEAGNIPMTNFPFEKYSSESVTKIGTAGGWVKGSTGYSFSHTDKKVVKIIENLKQNRKPSYGLIKRRYKFYDAVFLNVLKNENTKGEWIFKTFYSKNSAEKMFKFLDEETGFLEEMKIMSSLMSWTFIKSLFRTLKIF